jgi:predicted dehydrogenase
MDTEMDTLIDDPTRVNVGLIGCGNISSIYLQAPEKFPILRIVACADLAPELAQAKARQYHVPRVATVEDLLADPQIDLVLNLTTPRAHVEVGLAALAAGKAVYSEKPLGINRTEGRALLDAAQAQRRLIGCAPDTFLGGGLQTCIKLVNDGAIGEPVGATAFMLCHGHESWHPSPDFYYQPGGGPMFDMGPYYLTALIAMLGPVRRVTGSTRATFPKRVITSQPNAGKVIPVQTPTHIAGILDFANGAIATIITSFDVWFHQLPHIEVYGTEGTLIVPDPNGFGGPVFVRGAREQEWREAPLTHGWTENSRGIGVADMARAMRAGQTPRANGDLAYHVLDIMEAIHDSSREERHIILSSACQRPAPLPALPR